MKLIKRATNCFWCVVLWLTCGEGKADLASGHGGHLTSWSGPAVSSRLQVSYIWGGGGEEVQAASDRKAVIEDVML